MEYLESTALFDLIKIISNWWFDELVQKMKLTVVTVKWRVLHSPVNVVDHSMEVNKCNITDSLVSK